MVLRGETTTAEKEIMIDSKIPTQMHLKHATILQTTDKSGHKTGPGMWSLSAHGPLGEYMWDRCVEEYREEG